MRKQRDTEFGGWIVPVRFISQNKGSARGIYKTPEETLDIVVPKVDAMPSSGLVRLDYRFPAEGDKEYRFGNLIRDIQPGTERPKPLSPEEYFLYAEWKPWMEKKGEIPTFNELEKYYDPGFISWYVWTSGEKQKKKLIANRIRRNSDSERWDGKPSRLLNVILPPANESARLIVATDLNDLEGLIQEAERKGIKAIQMQPGDY